MTHDTIDVSIHVMHPSLTNAFPYSRSLHDTVSARENFTFPHVVEWCEERGLQIDVDDAYLRATGDQIVGFALSTEKDAIEHPILSGMFWTLADIHAFRAAWPSLFLVRYDLPMTAAFAECGAL